MLEINEYRVLWVSTGIVVSEWRDRWLSSGEGKSWPVHLKWLPERWHFQSNECTNRKRRRYIIIVYHWWCALCYLVRTAEHWSWSLTAISKCTPGLELDVKSRAQVRQNIMTSVIIIFIPVLFFWLCSLCLSATTSTGWVVLKTGRKSGFDFSLHPNPTYSNSRLIITGFFRSSLFDHMNTYPFVMYLLPVPLIVSQSPHSERKRV